MILRTQVLFILFLLHVCNSDAQEFHADMTTEVETDFKKRTNWLNLLRLSLSVKLPANLHFDASTLSLWQTRESGVSDDYQTFSDIFADNMLIAPAVLGLCWEKDCSKLFVGVQKADDVFINYQASGLFTNSSSATYPTMSMNSSIPVHPASAFGIYYAYSSKGWTAKAAVYNGKAGNKFTGRDNSFRICPKSDGVLSLCTIDYCTNNNVYMLGGYFYRARTAVLGYVEQSVSPSTCLVVEASVSPSSHADCKSYVAGGFTQSIKKTDLGLISNYARLADGKEWATEGTAKVSFSDNLYVQPAVDLIVTDGKTNVVGLLRAGYSL